MTTIRIPWRAWYGDEDLELSFPPSWQVQDYWPTDAPDIGPEGVEAAFDNPIGTPTIEELARGKRTVSIAVDDISRPVPAARLMPTIMRQLERGGIDLDNVRVVMGIGMHRPMVKEELAKKLGQAAVDRLEVHNSFPYGNLADLGTSARGTPVLISRFFAEAELKIGVGSITPHGGPGFGGGAKVVFPGVASYETVSYFHAPGRFKTGLIDVEHNELRAEIEQIAREKVGVDCIVNAVVNSRRGIAGLFVGDLVAAHRAGVQLAKKVYATEMPAKPVDIAICNAYPKDTDYLQNGMALNVLASSSRPVVKEGGTIVIISASPEGRGHHALYGPGMIYDPLRNQKEGVKRARRRQEASIVLFSPWLTDSDTRGEPLFRRWDGLIEHLKGQCGEAAVAVFPCGSIQLARESVA